MVTMSSQTRLVLVLMFPHLFKTLLDTDLNLGVWGWRPPKNNIINCFFMSKYLYLLVALLLLVGCHSADISSYTSKSDNQLTTISKYDSIIYRDSIYIYDRDTIKYVYKQRDNYHVKQYHDTIYKIYHDTIYSTNIQKKECSSSHERVDHPYFWIIFVSLLILIFIYKKFK